MLRIVSLLNIFFQFIFRTCHISHLHVIGDYLNPAWSIKVNLIMAEATEFSLHGTSSTAQPPIKVNGWTFPTASVGNCEPYIGVVYAPRGFPILQKLKRLCLKLSVENFHLQVVTNHVFIVLSLLKRKKEESWDPYAVLACVISCFRREAADYCALLGCYSASSVVH